jgi:hypothetical protein
MNVHCLQDSYIGSLSLSRLEGCHEEFDVDHDNVAAMRRIYRHCNQE